MAEDASLNACHQLNLLGKLRCPRGAICGEFIPHRGHHLSAARSRRLREVRIAARQTSAFSFAFV